MKFVIPEQEGEGDDLQHQEENKIKIPSDEEKYISHREIVLITHGKITSSRTDICRNV